MIYQTPPTRGITGKCLPLMLALLATLLMLTAQGALAHNVTEGDAGYVQEV